MLKIKVHIREIDNGWLLRIQSIFNKHQPDAGEELYYNDLNSLIKGMNEEIKAAQGLSRESYKEKIIDIES